MDIENVKFSKLYPLNEFPMNKLYHRVREHYLPTQVVVDTPQIVTPRVGRSYHTNYFYVDGNIVDSSKAYERFGPSRREEEDMAAIYLFEFWEDQGDYGGTYYVLTGYVFLTGSMYRGVYQDMERHFKSTPRPSANQLHWMTLNDIVNRYRAEEESGRI